MISFKLKVGDAKGPRLGLIATPHGEVKTPCFMPVGTVASVKGMAPWDLESVGVDIILANTYHLLLRPGIEVVRDLGGLHCFMGWSGPVLTDSGGYQVVSLGGRGHRSSPGAVELSENGVKFKSHLDGAELSLTPESVVFAQRDLGVDIAMALDVPVKLPAPEREVREAAGRTLRWAARSLEARDDKAAGTALFGIVQGGTDKALRAESAEKTAEMAFDGLAIGGLSVGEGPDDLHRVARHTAALLPAEKPRYLMGVGRPSDIIKAIGYGIDMFDCVLPTRNARNGWLYTGDGPIRIKRSKYKDDPSPPDEKCPCRVCSLFSRAYIRHLYMAGEMLAGMAITSHNLYFYMRLMKEARQAIKEAKYPQFAEQKLAKLTSE